MSPINKDNHINIINIAKNALKMKNSDTFYRIRIVLLTWVESTILIQSENSFTQLRTLHSNSFLIKKQALFESAYFVG